MKFGVIGSGIVGKTLSAGLLKHGHEVTIGTRDAGKLAAWAKENPKAKVAGVAEAAIFGQAVILAVNGSVASEALKAAGAANLAGKTVIDACNPIAEGAPVDGVVKFFTSLDNSLMERLQRDFPEAHFVKAFNSVGAALMIDPKFKEGKPTMFICGNDEGAKKAVGGIIEQFGWETADMGKASAARAIEPLCMLWLIPGLSRNQWGHAFKLLRQ